MRLRGHLVGFGLLGALSALACGDGESTDRPEDVGTGGMHTGGSATGGRSSGGSGTGGSSTGGSATGGKSSGGSETGGTDSGGTSGAGGSDTGGTSGSGGGTGGECSDGKFAKNGECVPWKTCVAGQFVSQEGTAASDQSCAGCVSGTFSSDENAASCDAWVSCPAGHYVANTPSAEEDRECAKCPDDTYTSGPDQAECLEATECPAGTVQITAGTSTSARVCEPCEAGTYCAGGEAEPVACATGKWDDDADAATPCIVKTACIGGQYVSAEGDALSDRTCEGCESGYFSLGGVATSCTLWSKCPAGEYVTNEPSAVDNRVCAECEEGTYTPDENLSTCQPQGSCAAGTVQTTPGSTSSLPVCEPCDVGTYCEGGTEPEVACGTGTWDHDAKPATQCANKLECVSGEYVTAEGDATHNRSCADCTSGYTVGSNATECTPWTVCGAGLVEATIGTPTTDRTCEPEEWVVEFGTVGGDLPQGVAVDADGNVYVSGNVGAQLPGHEDLGMSDVFVRKYDKHRNVLWTDQFGTSGFDYIPALSLDSAGRIYVAGRIASALPGLVGAGSDDAFVRIYDGAGSVVSTWQYGTSSSDDANALAVASNGSVYVAGATAGTWPGFTSAGESDAYLRKFDALGNVVWTRQFGSSGADTVVSMAIDASQNTYLLGSTAGSLGGLPAAGLLDIFLCKYDSAGNEVWTRQFGSPNADFPTSVAINANGELYVAGYTQGSLGSSSNAGADDLFVRKYDTLGTVSWTKQMGTMGNDRAYSLHVDAGGNAFVAGMTTGTFPGQTNLGFADALLLRLDAAGAPTLARHYGTGTDDGGRVVTLDANGRVILAGTTSGSFPGQANGGASDIFVARLVP